MSGDNETPAWISAVAGVDPEKPAWATTTADAAKAADTTTATTPAVTLDPVDVTAKAPDTQTNPTAPTAEPYTRYEAPTPAGGDDLTLIIDKTEWSGWQRVQLTRSMDTVPANFNIAVTEHYPNLPDINIKPGVACQVKLGGDLVLTGHIDRYSAQLSARDHTVNISGRSNSADLVDCAAFVGDPHNEIYQVSGGSALSVIKQLAKPYGIEVQSNAGEGPNIPTFPLNFGETVWEVIDRITKVAQFVAYDLPDGNLMLARAGTEEMASGFVQAVNVEEAEVNFTMDQRFSDYFGFMHPSAILTEGGGGHEDPQAKAEDGDVPRFRKRIIVSEQTNIDGSLLQQRVDWERNRRAGRSMAINVTCDSWRDTGNMLWTPNHLAEVNVPALKIPDTHWCIGQVTYIKDERGRHAIVLLMPASAFQVEPTVFNPLPPTETNQGHGEVNPTSTHPADAPAGPADPITGNPVNEPEPAPQPAPTQARDPVTGEPL